MLNVSCEVKLNQNREIWFDDSFTNLSETNMTLANVDTKKPEKVLYSV